MRAQARHSASADARHLLHASQHASKHLSGSASSAHSRAVMDQHPSSKTCAFPLVCRYQGGAEQLCGLTPPFLMMSATASSLQVSLPSGSTSTNRGVPRRVSPCCAYFNLLALRAAALQSRLDLPGRAGDRCSQRGAGWLLCA